VESTLNRIAEKILALDEASLNSLWQKYKFRMEQFDTGKEWEKSVIIFFIINSVRAKNQIFNEHILSSRKGSPGSKRTPKKKPHLKIIK
jgi:hypothetical protein